MELTVRQRREREVSDGQQRKNSRYGGGPRDWGSQQLCWSVSHSLSSLSLALPTFSLLLSSCEPHHHFPPRSAQTAWHQIFLVSFLYTAPYFIPLALVRPLNHLVLLLLLLAVGLDWHYTFSIVLCVTVLSTSGKHHTDRFCL